MKTKNENVGTIDPRVDEFINKLLDTTDRYDLNSQSKKILNYVIYLLLNRKFQHILQSFRLSLCMPVDGLRNKEEQDLWRVKFKEIVNKYHNGEATDKGVKCLIERIEKDLNRPLIDMKSRPNTIVVDICGDTIIKTTNYIFQFLNLRNTKNVVYWLVVVRELLFFNSPAKIVDYLFEWSKVFGAQSISFEQKNNRIKMTIMLYPDTTIKDIERLIEYKRSKISEEINKIRGLTRENQSKTDDIKRDYFIYRTYMNQKITRKRGNNIYFNVTKAEAVKNKAEKSIDIKGARGARYLELKSIRQVVGRMNKRIKNAFPNSPTKLNMFLGVIAPRRRT